ncbi:hypothetical protein SMACR_08064 [Sordaria macrospora]|uniref:Uncharacterized protein n=1 Tax=Sordaria macrospora TaxID=5147 RepID=A0A8S8ZLR4_SORMA|nr:hypothetical protein SMACR_08064 [Sordaria macrospora]KAH7628823.1 hypothetical protein B0T09DRAFT_344731 [Sordaria sp. MPI-SDFR-AT-0083]WPJ57276.1 hypothetical protein SMAC4_08064 [Sordaria macrospora]
MNRQVVTSTLSRRGVALDCCRATSTLLNTSRPFSTTTRQCEDDKPSANKPDAAPRAPASPSRQKSEAAVGKLTQLRGSFTSLTDDNSFQKAPPAGARDLRRFAAPINRDGRSGTVSPLGGGGGAGGGPSGAPKVINVRSLKGTLGRGRFAPGGGVPGAVAPSTAFRPRFGAGAGGPGAGDRRSAGPGGPPGRPRFGAPGSGAGGPRTAGARRPGFIKRPKPARGGEKKPRRGEDEDERPPSEEEIAFINTLEQGKVSEYVPKLTPDTLLGYGPPMATDAALGKVETALRTMRILGGGLPFNTESGVTSDPTAVKHRYLHEKKPVFFSSVEEKEWLEESLDKFALSQGPKDKTKRAILETSVLGKYEAPKFVESITDTVAMVEKYQGSTFSYASSDANKFKAKLNQLLAAGQPRAAAPAQKKA